MLVEQTQQAQLVFAVDDGGRRGAGAVVAGRSEDFVEPIELGSPATRQLEERLELALLLVAAHPRDLGLPGRAFRAATGAGRFVALRGLRFRTCRRHRGRRPLPAACADRRGPCAGPSAAPGSGAARTAPDPIGRRQGPLERRAGRRARRWDRACRPGATPAWRSPGAPGNPRSSPSNRGTPWRCAATRADPRAIARPAWNPSRSCRQRSASRRTPSGRYLTRQPRRGGASPRLPSRNHGDGLTWRARWRRGTSR